MMIAHETEIASSIDLIVVVPGPIEDDSWFLESQGQVRDPRPGKIRGLGFPGVFQHLLFGLEAANRARISGIGPNAALSAAPARVLGPSPDASPTPALTAWLRSWLQAPDPRLIDKMTVNLVHESL
jgi:hypothetical protein